MANPKETPANRAQRRRALRAGVPLGYRINELCESLGVSRPTVYAWMAAGQLEYYQLDGFRIVTAKSLEDFLERRLKSSSA